MNPINLSSVTAIKALPIKKKKYRVRDVNQPGLIITVYPSGVKSWGFYKKVPKTNKIMDITFGKFPDLKYAQVQEAAKKKAEELATQSFNILNNIHQQIVATTTLEKWFKNSYISQYCCNKEPATIKKNLSLFSTISRQNPNITQKPIFNIYKGDLLQLHNNIKDQTSVYTANRAIALLKTMYNTIIKENFQPFGFSNPAKGISLPKEEARQTYIPNIPLLLTELSNYGNKQFENFIKLLLFSGRRCSEILSLDWDSFKNTDLQHQTLLTTDTYSVYPKGKNKLGKQIFPLCQKFKDVIIDMYKNRTSKWLFPSPSDKEKHIKITSYEHMWQNFMEKYYIPSLKATGVNIDFSEDTNTTPQFVNYTKTDDKGNKIICKRRKRVNHIFRLHDLRKTVGSNMIKAHKSSEQVAKVLGNTPAMVQRSYSTLLQADKQQDLQDGINQMFA